MAKFSENNLVKVKNDFHKKKKKKKRKGRIHIVSAPKIEKCKTNDSFEE